MRSTALDEDLAVKHLVKRFARLAVLKTQSRDEGHGPEAICES